MKYYTTSPFRPWSGRWDLGDQRAFSEETRSAHSGWSSQGRFSSTGHQIFETFNCTLSPVCGAPRTRWTQCFPFQKILFLLVHFIFPFPNLWFFKTKNVWQILKVLKTQYWDCASFLSDLWKQILKILISKDNQATKIFDYIFILINGARQLYWNVGCGLFWKWLFSETVHTTLTVRFSVETKDIQSYKRSGTACFLFQISLSWICEDYYRKTFQIKSFWSGAKGHLCLLFTFYRVV